MNVCNHILDNPAWFALSGVQMSFAMDYGDVKFFNPLYGPFGASLTPLDNPLSIERHAELSNPLFIIGNEPKFSLDKFHKSLLVCDQMVLDAPVNIDIGVDIIPLQSDKQRKELYELIMRVQPGYFKLKTVELGNYYGIYQKGQLVAAAGERMKLYDYIEISAIVTLPTYRGRGYAKQLIKKVSDEIYAQEATPFLHVVESNQYAIKLYNRLGFRLRTKINFWKFLSK